MEKELVWKCKKHGSIDKLIEVSHVAGELALKNAYSETCASVVNQVNAAFEETWRKMYRDIGSFLCAMCDVSRETIVSEKERLNAIRQDDGSVLITLDELPLMYYTITESEKENGEYSLIFGYHLKMWRADVQES